MRKRLLRIFGLLIILSIFIIPCVPVLAGTTYYVSTTGNDGNDGLGAGNDHAWLTIQHAADTVVAGDTVYVRGGTYDISSARLEITNVGTAIAPILFKNYLSESPIIDRGNQSKAIYINDAAYVTISGFEIRDSSYFGVHVNGTSNHITLENLVIHQTGASAIFLGKDVLSPDYGVEDIIVDNCTIYDTNNNSDQEQISIGSVDGFEIMNCTTTDSYTQSGICTKLGAKNGSIHDNDIANGRTGILMGGYGDSTNIDIFNNVIHDNTLSGAVGIDIESEDVSSDQTDINIYNNILYNNYRGLVIEPPEGAYVYTKTISIINNTFYHNGTMTEIFLADDSDYVGCVIRNNIIYGATNGMYAIYFPYYSFGGVTIDHNLFYNSGGSWNGSNRIGTSPVISNPLFTNASVYDFTLTISSPAIDSGSSISAPTTDYNGTARPQGSGYDIGAYEAGSTITTPVISGSVATSITQTAARLNSLVTNGGGDANCSVRFGYGLVSQTPSNFGLYTTITSWVSGYKINDTPYVDIIGLTTNTTYYFSVQIKNTLTTSTSTYLSFTTLSAAVTAPNITAMSASNIAVTTARLNAYIIADGNDISVQVRFGYGTTTQTAVNFAAYDTVTAWVDGYHILNTPYLDVASLVAATPYYYRVQVKNSNSTVTSANEISFTTIASLADVAIFNGYPNATSISLNWVKPSGSTNVLVRYRMDTFPTTTADGTQVYYGSGFNYIQTGLSPGATYYYSMWSESGGVYGATAANLVLTTDSNLDEGDSIPTPELPNNMNQSPSSSAWYTNLQPFTGIIATFTSDWGMPRDNGMLAASALVMVFLAVGTYLKTKNFFIAYAVLLALDLGAVGMHVMFGWSIFIIIALGLGAWSIEHYYQ